MVVGDEQDQQQQEEDATRSSNGGAERTPDAPPLMRRIGGTGFARGAPLPREGEAINNNQPHPAFPENGAASFFPPAGENDPLLVPLEDPTNINNQPAEGQQQPQATTPVPSSNTPRRHIRSRRSDEDASTDTAVAVVNGQPPPPSNNRQTQRFRVRVPAGQQRPQGIRFDPQTNRIQLDMGQGNIIGVPVGPAAAAGNAAPGARQTTTTTTIPNARVTTTTTGPTIADQLTGNRVRVTMHHPLTPVPVLSAANNDSNGPPIDERFQCTLCCEAMDAPLSCPRPNCSSRFCRACDTKVRNSNAHGLPKCPSCRMEWATTLKVDEALQQDMIAQGSIFPCQHCSEPFLLTQLVAHEASCPSRPMKCRFHAYGCPFVGANIAEHEQNECRWMPLRVLVEDVRRMQTTHGSQLSILQEQTQGSLRMAGVHHQNLQRSCSHSTHNPFRLMEYVTMLLMSTSHVYGLSHDAWSSWWRTADAQATVLNRLTMLPWTIMSLSQFLKGGVGLVACMKGQQQQDRDDFLVDLGESVLLLVTASIFFGIIFYIIMLDTRSSRQWRSYPFLGRGTTFPLGKDVTAMFLCITLCTMLDALSFRSSEVLEYDSAGAVTVTAIVAAFSPFTYVSSLGPRSIFLLWALYVTTFFFPAIVEQVNAGLLVRMPTRHPVGQRRSFRMYEPISFGLRFSGLVVCFGLYPTLDAAAIYALLFRHFSHEEGRWYHPHLPRSVCQPNAFLDENLASKEYVAVRLLSIAWIMGESLSRLMEEDEEKATAILKGSWFQKALWLPVAWEFVRALLATCSLLGINYLTHRLVFLGHKVGDRMVHNVVTTSRRTPPPTREELETEQNRVGTMTVMVWSGALASIAILSG